MLNNFAIYIVESREENLLINSEGKIKKNDVNNYLSKKCGTYIHHIILLKDIIYNYIPVTSLVWLKHI